jgi:hypothetical protein
MRNPDCKNTAESHSYTHVDEHHLPPRYAKTHFHCGKDGWYRKGRPGFDLYVPLQTRKGDGSSLVVA